MRDSLCIVMPAYNEEENLEKVLADWYPVLRPHEGDGKSKLIVVDDGSTDGTYGMLLRLKEQYPLLCPVRKENGGHGPALIEGYRLALLTGADYIFQTDSDGQTLSSEFERFWRQRLPGGAVIGFRPVRGDGAFRAFVEKVLCAILFVIFGVRLKDANAPFRLMHRDLLASYLGRIAPDYALPNVMLTTFFAYYHEPVRFRRITFRDRQGGSGSINLKKIFFIGLREISAFLRFRSAM